MKFAAVLAGVAAAALAVSANAQSVSETTSVADTQVTATIPNLVSIEGLNDIVFDLSADDINNPFFGGVDRNEKFCVYSNVTADGNYNIRVDGKDGADAEFALEGAEGDLDMAVWISDDETNAFKGYTWPGFTQTGYKTANGGKPRATDLNCSNVGGTNASLQLRLSDAEILAAVAGEYNGTLTLTVSVP